MFNVCKGGWIRNDSFNIAIISKPNAQCSLLTLVIDPDEINKWGGWNKRVGLDFFGKLIRGGGLFGSEEHRLDYLVQLFLGMVYILLSICESGS